MSENNITSLTQGDIVISTRIRLARNIADVPFPCRMNSETAMRVAKSVSDAIINGKSAIAERFRDIDMEDISKEEAISLVERHLVSPDFISDTKGRHLLLLDDESVSIMVNEEDHIRIQVLQQGLKLDEAYETADRIDALLDENLKIAYNDTLGYLTQCPTNLGTGMRASLMLHLPALQKSRAMDRISANLSKLGFTIRGLYGEGSEPKGAIYQLSNQVTLGISEQTAIANLKNIAMQIIEQERSIRRNMVKNIGIADLIYRSLGILKNARLMSNDEAMQLLSNVRLGIAEGMLKDLNITTDKLNSLLTDIQPGILIKKAKKHLTAEERDTIRADMLRKAFSE